MKLPSQKHNIYLGESSKELVGISIQSWIQHNLAHALISEGRTVAEKCAG
jgi:hypothetical protein